MFKRLNNSSNLIGSGVGINNTFTTNDASDAILTSTYYNAGSLIQ